MKALQGFIRDIPDFPKKGILFRDITPLLGDAGAFKRAVNEMVKHFSKRRIDRVVGVEARGFLFGGAIAYKLGAGVIPVRKQGKLPYRTKRVTYALEYGEDSLELHEDAIRPGERVLVVDDLLATGGTAKAVAKLVESTGGKIVSFVFLVELTSLHGRHRLDGYEVLSLIQFP